MPGPHQGAARDWQAAARDIGRSEADYLFHSSFADPAQAEQILAAEPFQPEPTLGDWKPGRDLPAHLARLCETPLLGQHEETNLFRRMNYAKYRADLLRRRLVAKSPDRLLIVGIERLRTLALWDRNRIVQANLRLVVSIARKFALAGGAFDDLLSEGIESLLKAVEKFDFARGFRFSTYATMAVRRTLVRHVQNDHRRRTRFQSTDDLRLQETPEHDSSGSLTEARWTELNRALARMLARLDPREQAIIRSRFGLSGDRQVKTLQALADELGICKERVRQLETRAIARMRSMSEQIRLAPPDEA